jgi:hypothetical protein
VLLRPDTYIGSTEMNRTKLWVYEEGGLAQREVPSAPQPLGPQPRRPCDTWGPFHSRN